MKKRTKYKYFEWGDEKPGYVTTWTVAPDGSVRLGARIRYEEGRSGWKRPAGSKNPL